VSATSTPDRRNEQYEALFDRSTGLPVEALLLDRIDIAMRRSQRMGKKALIAQLEVDIANEDETLARSVAAQLASAVRSDDTVARSAPHEFVVVCNDLTTDDEVRLILGRVVDRLHRPLAVAGEPTQLVSRVGVVFGDTARDPYQLLENARRAMLAADWTPSTA
jgi:GGDEF domain-containing protein